MIPGSLFDDTPTQQSVEVLGEQAVLLHAFALQEAPRLFADIKRIVEQSPFRHMVTRGGFKMSVAMSNCGRVGWISDRKGYRYDSIDPLTGSAWPEFPFSFVQLASRAAAESGFPNFEPDACLINRYAPGARMSLHQDKDEGDFRAPIVSVSLGLPATFLFGGQARSDKTSKYRVENGDVVVWGGLSRLVYHGVAPLAEGEHPLTGNFRINLTFRRAL